MGYYSYFKLSTAPEAGASASYADVLSAILKIREGNSDKFYPFEDILEEFNQDPDAFSDNVLEPEEEAKWYDYDEEMVELSRLLPDVLLLLHVEGEEAGDVSDNYYKDGKSCRYEPIMPPFNPDDLK